MIQFSCSAPFLSCAGVQRVFSPHGTPGRFLPFPFTLLLLQMRMVSFISSLSYTLPSLAPVMRKVAYLILVASSCCCFNIGRETAFCRVAVFAFTAEIGLSTMLGSSTDSNPEGELVDRTVDIWLGEEERWAAG